MEAAVEGHNLSYGPSLLPLCQSEVVTMYTEEFAIYCHGKKQLNVFQLRLHLSHKQCAKAAL